MTKARCCDLCGFAIVDGSPAVGWATLHATDLTPFQDLRSGCVDGDRFPPEFDGVVAAERRCVSAEI